MTLEEALAENTALKAKISEMEGKSKKDAADAATASLKDSETKIATLAADLEAAKAARTEADNARKDAEADKAKALTEKADAEAAIPAKVAERVKLEFEAAKVLGAVDEKNQPIDRSAIPARDLKCQVIKHVDNDDYSDEKKFDNSYVNAMYDGAIKRHARGVTAVAAAAVAVEANRKDGAEAIIPTSGTSAEAKAADALRNNLSTAWMPQAK